MLIHTIITINWIILWYFIILSFSYIFLLAAAIPDILRRNKEAEVSFMVSTVRSRSMPPVTIIIPAYNEEANILETIFSILKSTYSNVHIIVVNADSTDSTLDVLVKTFDMEEVKPLLGKDIPTIGKVRGYYISEVYPNITVIDKSLRERSDAINTGLNACHTPLFATIDADTLIEREALSRIIFYMLSKPHTIAVGGSVYVLNGCTFSEGEITTVQIPANPLYGFQIDEYLKSFLFNRSGWNALGGALSYAGAFTIFQHKAVMDIGGYVCDNAAQDFEIITHLHAYNLTKNVPYHIGFTPSAAVWTDVPGTLKDYWIQRRNWQDGIIKSMAPYFYMMFNPRYGVVGLYTYPFFFFNEMLSAIVEFTAYVMVLLCWYLGILDVLWASLFFTICWGFAVFLMIANVLINFISFRKYTRLRELFWLLFLALIEPFGFRQYNVICRVWATTKYLINILKFRKPS